MDIKLGELEAALLYAIIHCGGDAYGVSISETLRKRKFGEVAMGAIYATLDRLEKKELVRSWWSEPSSERGGRRKRLYEISGGGRAALHNHDTRLMSIRAGWRSLQEAQ